MPGVKPKVEAIRIGLKVKKQAPRPMKFLFLVSNSTIVNQSLIKASNLQVHISDQFKKVFQFTTNELCNLIWYSEFSMDMNYECLNLSTLRLTKAGVN